MRSLPGTGSLLKIEAEAGVGPIHCGQLAAAGKGDVGGVPARAGPYAVGVLEGREELMPQERVAISPERIPLPRVELVDAVVKA